MSHVVELVLCVCQGLSHVRPRQNRTTLLARRFVLVVRRMYVDVVKFGGFISFVGWNKSYINKKQDKIKIKLKCM